MQQIELQPWERDHMNHKVVTKLAEVGMLWTLKMDGDILAIVGFFEHWQGVFEVIVFPSVHTHKAPVFYVKKIRHYLNIIAQSFGMRRQQTVSTATPEQDRWMRLLGFELEGTLKAYTVEGLDCKQWARFPEWQ